MLFYKQLEPGGLFYTQTKTTVITFTGKVVVALLKNPEIGLESYNDHHFQYSYLLYSAGILAKYKPSFVTEYKNMIDLVAADIASTSRDDTNFPYLRVFDFYQGHSWASGFGKFRDGNNQESSSEAVQAWYGLWLWGKYSENPEMQKTGEYLYSSEINSAEFYWLNRSDDKSIFPEGYNYKIASIVWGGKYDFATFFSGDLSAIYGIQMLPVTAGSGYLYDPKYIQRDADLLYNYLTTNNGSLVDMIAMYIATLPEYYNQLQPKLDTIQIDQGNSRANMYTWIFYWQGQKG
jgi:endo-1,3(4)-beta-glucanase